MLCSIGKVCLTLCLAVGWVEATYAQGPELKFLFPPGAQVGQTIEIELVGKQVETAERFYTAAKGIEARSLGKSRFSVTIAPDATVGEYDVWAVSPKGLSAPARLVVSALPGQVEREPNTIAEPQIVELPTIVDGKIEPGVDADWYQVRLASGDGLTAACRSVTLGGLVWPTITVLDPQGREIAHDAMTHLEPTIHFRAEIAGEYRIGIQDRSYRLTAAPFYRLTLTQGPWLSTAYPTALERDKSQRVVLIGYRLPEGKPVAGGPQGLEQIEVDLKAPAHGSAAAGAWTPSQAVHVESFSYRHPGVEGSVRFELIDRTPVVVATKPSEPPLLTLPFDVAGQFTSSRHSVDRFRFAAKKGQSLWLEAVSQRVDRPCDLELSIYDAAGKTLETFGNIVIPKGEPTTLPLESRDPAGSWKAPDDGEYTLAVRDLLGTVINPGERAYRLSIGPRLEDVRVVALLGESATSSGWSISPGKKITIPLVAVRRGGHQAPIEIRGEALPAGMTVAPVTMAKDKSTANLTIEATKDATPWVGAIRLLATSEVDRKSRTVEVPLAVPLPAGISAGARLIDGGTIAILK